MERLALLLFLIFGAPVLALAQDMPPLELPPDPPPTNQAPPSDVFWSANIFTEILRLVKSAMTVARWPLFEQALAMLHWLAVLEVTLTWLFLAFSDDAQSLIGTMCGQLLAIGFCVELISQFPMYAEAWADGCAWVGLQIGNVASVIGGENEMTVADFQAPGTIILKGLGNASIIFDYLIALGNMSWYNMIKALILEFPLMLAFWASVAANFGMGMLITAAWIVSWTLMAFAIPFLPFLICKATRWIGMSALVSVVEVGIDLGMLAAVVSLMNGVIVAVTIIDPENLTVGTGIAAAAVSCFFVFLALCLIKKIHGKFSGGSFMGRHIRGGGH